MLLLILLKVTSCIEYLPIFGGSEVPGYYFANVRIGTPATPRVLMIDVGSELISLACTSCTSCGKHLNSYYDFRNSSSSKLLKRGTNGTDVYFNYSINYVDKSNIQGFLLRDNLQLDLLSNSINLRLTFGCNIIEKGLFDNLQADGVLGLAPSSSIYYSLMNSLYSSFYIDRKVFSICLGEFDGFITFGGINETLNKSPMSTTRFHQSNLYQFYLSQLSFDGSKNGNFLTSDESFILSSGSSISYFNTKLFERFIFQFKEYCKDPNKCLDSLTDVKNYKSLCFKTSHKSFFSFSSYPVLHFSHLDFHVQWEPQDYMIRTRGSKSGVFCVGVLESPIEGINILGTNFFRNKQILFDNENFEIKISPAVCSPLFISNTQGVSLIHKESKISEILTYAYLFTTNILLILAYFLSVYSLSTPESK